VTTHDELISALDDVKEQRKAKAEQFEKQKQGWNEDLNKVRECYAYLE